MYIQTTITAGCSGLGLRLVCDGGWGKERKFSPPAAIVPTSSHRLGLWGDYGQAMIRMGNKVTMCTVETYNVDLNHLDRQLLVVLSRHYLRYILVYNSKGCAGADAL